MFVMAPNLDPFIQVPTHFVNWFHAHRSWPKALETGTSVENWKLFSGDSIGGWSTVCAAAAIPDHVVLLGSYHFLQSRAASVSSKYLTMKHSSPGLFFSVFGPNSYVAFLSRSFWVYWLLHFLGLQLKMANFDCAILSLQFLYLLALHDGWNEVLETLPWRGVGPWLQPSIFKHIYPLSFFIGLKLLIRVFLRQLGIKLPIKKALLFATHYTIEGIKIGWWRSSKCNLEIL